MFTKISCAMLMLAVVTAVSLNSAVSAQTQRQIKIHDHRKKASSETHIHDHRKQAPKKTNIHDHRKQIPGGLKIHDHRNETTASIDRFDVKVDVLQFRSLLKTDTALNHPDVNYYYNVHADIAGVRRQSLVRGKATGRPMETLDLVGAIQFGDVEKPAGANRLIRISTDVRDQYQSRTDGEKKSRNLHKASGATSINLFKMAAQSQDHESAQTVLIRNRNYLMIVRVTVTELD